MNLQDIIGDLTKMSHKTQRRINRDRKSLNRSSAQVEGNLVFPRASRDFD